MNLEQLRETCRDLKLRLYAAQDSGAPDAELDAIRREGRAAVEALRTAEEATARDRRRQELAGGCPEWVPLTWLRAASWAEHDRVVRSPVLLRSAKAFAAGERSLLLCGPTGVGKSTAAALLARLFSVETGRRGEWVQARELALAPSLWPLGQGECREITYAKQARLLVLDDLGLEKDHGPLLDVLERRYADAKPTVTTTGLSVPQLKQRYGEAFFRRLVECDGKPGGVVEVFPQERTG